MTQPAGKKISQFIGITELADSDYVTLVSAGVNYKMLVSDFKTAMGLPGSTPRGLISMQGNTTDTDIVTQAVPVLVAGTWNSQVVEGFSASAAGRLTYILDNTRAFVVDACASMHPVSGSRDCAFMLAKNGTVIADSLMFASVTSGGEQEISTNWIVSLAQNDYVEVFVSNLDGAQDITVNSAIIRVTGCL
jgi:hypothetical protein